jgi:dihydropteroate synthase
MSGLLTTLRYPAVMGVVNVTPDSFSDGGAFLEPARAIAHGLRLAEEGADIVDVGGESTRPGSDPVPAEVELARVLPVVSALAAEGLRVSIDTAKAAVAEAALDAGAVMVNDVTALRGDPRMGGVVARAGASLCLMHMLGVPKTMQDDPRYDDVVGEVEAFLRERLAVAVEAGISEEEVCLDPGIGFGKTLAHNVELLHHLDALVRIGRPVVIGASRKRFIGAITGREEGERIAGTVAANVAALLRGASVFRVHDVRENREALDVAAAIMDAP